jgi:hypothetical protein
MKKKEGRLATYLVRIYLFMVLIFDVFLAFSFAIQWNPQYFPSLTSIEPQEGLEQPVIGVDEKKATVIVARYLFGAQRPFMISHF